MLTKFILAAVAAIVMYRYVICMTDEVLYGGHSSIAKWGKADLSVIGNYDERLRNSVRYWVYAVMVAVYEKTETDPYNICREWYMIHDDPRHFISNGVEDARTKFLHAIDEAREMSKKADFKVSHEYDYHMLPKSLLFNDYVNCQWLIDRIDSVMGGT